MLVKLLEFEPFPVQSKVVVIMQKGTLSRRIESLGVEIEYLGLNPRRMPNILQLLRLLRISRKFNPNVIQGWMYHGNLGAWLIKRIACPRAKLLWGVRQTLYDISSEKRLTRWLITVSRWLSGSPEKIIYNSSVSAAQHETFGYPKHSTVVIPNGFDLHRFRPDESARKSVSEEFGFVPSTPLVIHVSRYHPMKDHANLLHAISQLLAENSSIKFLLVGREVVPNNPTLLTQCIDMGLGESLILAGERSDTARLMAAADVAVLSSAWGEGFPNVVGEAMACGTPCVVTDVGDAARVVGECGIVVPPHNPGALAGAIGELLFKHDLRLNMSNKARQRIQNFFTIEKVANRYLDLYQGNII